MYPQKPIVRARDLMQRAVITLRPEARLLAAHRLLSAEGLHGAPVIDEAGVLCGVVSALDIVRETRDEAPGGMMTTTYFRDELPYVGADWLDLPAHFPAKLQQRTVADAMTCEVVRVETDATVDEVARMMLQHHVHRLLVTERRVLEGVITTFDLLRVLSRVGVPLSGAALRTGVRRGELQ